MLQQRRRVALKMKHGHGVINYVKIPTGNHVSEALGLTSAVQLPHLASNDQNQAVLAIQAWAVLVEIQLVVELVLVLELVLEWYLC